jgi:hypothetical protein
MPKPTKSLGIFKRLTLASFDGYLASSCGEDQWIGPHEMNPPAPVETSSILTFGLDDQLAKYLISDCADLVMVQGR